MGVIVPIVNGRYSVNCEWNARYCAEFWMAYIMLTVNGKYCVNCEREISCQLCKGDIVPTVVRDTDALNAGKLSSKKAYSTCTQQHKRIQAPTHI